MLVRGAAHRARRALPSPPASNGLAYDYLTSRLWCDPITTSGTTSGGSTRAGHEGGSRRPPFYPLGACCCSFEDRGDLRPDPVERAAHLTFIIAGAGPTGVELAGAIKELAVDVIPRDYRVADTRQARVMLIEAGPRLLPALPPEPGA